MNEARSSRGAASIHFSRILILLLGLALLAGLAQPQTKAAAQDVKTATPTVTNGPADRPLVVIKSYWLDKDSIRVGDSFTLYISLKNDGATVASNLILSMINDNFLPQANGGVVALGSLGSGQDQTVAHQFLVSNNMWGLGTGTIPVMLSYNGPDGTAYTASFAVTLQLWTYNGPVRTNTPTPTLTSAPIVRPQLVVGTYSTSVDPLQPGSLFDMEISLHNLGNADARAVTMVLGGGVTPDVSGTQTPGGTSGGSSELTNFAPIGSSNLFYIGDLPAGQEYKVKAHLIVNVSTVPGAYTLKLSFVYNDPKGNRLVDEQIVTLLVYQLPQVEVNFYRDPGQMLAGQPNVLPIQVVNLGRKSTVLGNLKITAPEGEISNNVSLVGPLDPGGSFTLDANYVPVQAGESELQVEISYTDDFNQARKINTSIKVNVQEGMPVQPELTPGVPSKDGGIPAPVEETAWDKVVRFLKGLFGLDSGQSQNNGGGGDQTSPTMSPDIKVVPNSAPLKGP